MARWVGIAVDGKNVIIICEFAGIFQHPKGRHSFHSVSFPRIICTDYLHSFAPSLSLADRIS